MERFFSQPNTRFCKLNHVAYCAIAYAEGDVRDFCRNFLLAIMDRKNRVVLKSSITTVIHQLTGWEIRNINKTIQGLVKRREFVRRGNKEIQFNPLLANRVIVYDQYRLGYNGENPHFSEEQHRMIDEIQRLIKSAPNEKIAIDHTERDDEMSAVLQKLETVQAQLDEMKTAMQFLIARAKKSDADEAQNMMKSHLSLVKG